MRAHPSDSELANDPGVELLAGLAAIGTAVAGIAYAVAFVGLKSNLWSAVFLLLGSALSLFVLVAVYERFRAIEPRIARWALIVAAIGAAGGLIHGGYDLASTLHPEFATSGLPNPVDPRGLLTFGASGVALLTGAWLVTLSRDLPGWAAWLAGLTGLALMATNSRPNRIRALTFVIARTHGRFARSSTEIAERAMMMTMTNARSDATPNGIGCWKTIVKSCTGESLPRNRL
jgi:hypothetical protein